MPEICRMCGEFTVPPHTITSRFARTASVVPPRRTSTPTQW
jgi:hypothetical protein